MAIDRNIIAYAWPPSVDLARGQTLKLVVASKDENARIQIALFGLGASNDLTNANATPLWTTSVVQKNGRAVNPPGNATPVLQWFEHSIPLSANWRGLMFARTSAPLLTPYTDNIFVVPFCIFDSNSKRPILVHTSFFTDHAYNKWGGSSFYGSDDASVTNEVSLRRPLWNDGAPWLSSRANYTDPLEIFFLTWLSKEALRDKEKNIERSILDYVDVCTNYELHNTPDILTDRQLIISVGHHEYWSEQMLKAVRGAIVHGTHYMSLGGNNCWRKVQIQSHNGDVTMSLRRAGRYGTAAEYWHGQPDPNLNDYMVFGLSSVWGAIQGCPVVGELRGLAIVGLPAERHWAHRLVRRLPGCVDAGTPIPTPRGDVTNSNYEFDGARLGSDGRAEYSGYFFEGNRMPAPQDFFLFANATIRFENNDPCSRAHATVPKPPAAAARSERVQTGYERDRYATSILFNRIGKGLVFSCGIANWVAEFKHTGLDGDMRATNRVKKKGDWEGNEPAVLTRNALVELAEIDITKPH